VADTDQDLGSLVKELLRQEVLAGLFFTRIVVIGAGFVAAFAVVLSFNKPGSVDFYKSAASVIPALLLTLAVQGRFFRLGEIAKSPLRQALETGEVDSTKLKRFGVSGWQAWIILSGARLTLAQIAGLTRGYTFALLLSIAGGEGMALYVIATGAPDAVLLAFVSAAMVAEFLAIAAIALVGIGDAPDQARAVEARLGWGAVLEKLGVGPTAGASGGEPGAPTDGG
jgi:hypothetical protein